MKDREKEYLLGFLDDVLEQINYIEIKMKKISKEKFYNEELISSSVIRNFEIIGEALKNIPHQLIASDDFEDLQKAKKMRDVLIHDYRKINTRLVYETYQNDIPNLKNKVLELKTRLSKSL